MKKAFSPQSSRFKGFSIIELVVVIGLSAALLLAVSGYLIFSLQRSNQISVENSVKYESNVIMDTLSRDVRKSACECFRSDYIALFGSSTCDQTFCTTVPVTIPIGPTPYAVYQVSDDGLLNLTRNSVVLNSDSVKVQNCSNCACTPPFGDGFVISKPSTQKREYFVTLSLRQSKNNPRSDYCGKVQLQETIKTRNY